MNEQRIKLEATGFALAPGKFKVLAIVAGKAKGWTFTTQVLQESLELWDGVTCFVDHGSWFSRRSVKDIGGVFSDPTWNEEKQGIELELEASGPSSELVTLFGRELVRDGEPKPNVGFSADIFFSAKPNREVKQISRIESLDLVYSPAAGGAFLRALNQTNQYPNMEELNMPPNIPENTDSPPDETPVSTQMQDDLAAVEQLATVQAQQLQLAEEAEQVRQVRAEMCTHLLDSSLAAAKLPASMTDHVRKQFAGIVFEPPELTAAIEEARELVSSLTGGATVQGPNSVSQMFSSGDQLQAAVDDLLAAPRDKGMEDLKAHRLTGIRELYHMMTGDYDMYGGYYPERAMFATTADFTGLVKNALNKIVVNQWSLLGRAGYDWWTRVTAQEHFTSIQSITGTLVGTVGELPTVSEGAEYTELAIGDSPETASFVKYGGYIPLTLELIDRDETRKLRAYPRELANAGIRRLSGLVAAIFTDNSGIGPTMADTGALFNATAVTTAGGHANLLTTALSASEWDVVQTAVYDQPMLIKQATGYYGTGPKQAINTRYCLVPRNLELTAKKILYPSWENLADIHSENMQRGQMGDVVVVPEWTDANNWAAAIDPVIAPAIFVGERFGIMPEIFIAGSELSPAVFMNDEHRLKVRHFLAVWVNDFRPLHKSNVA
jgi:hypothetical protein